MKSTRWTDAVRVLSLLVTAFFFAAAVLQAVLSFELTGAAPADTDDFIESIIQYFTCSGWASLPWQAWGSCCLG
jgi:hypothetical protein